MAKIIWDGFLKDFPEMEYHPLPPNAVKLRIPDRNMTVSMVFSLPFLPIMFLSWEIKSRMYDTFVLNRPYAAIGILAGLLLIFVHELLHVSAYPRDAERHIGVIPAKWMAYASCPAPLSRGRFIYMSLAPMILGWIPFILFWLSPAEWGIVQAVLWPCAMIGFLSPSPDYLNVYCVLRQVPRHAVIQDAEDEMYWYPAD